MKSSEMALDYITRAERTLNEAKNALLSKDYPLTIKRSQETVELSLKAVLRYLAIEYPKDHDVGDILLQAVKIRNLPDWFKVEVDFMVNSSIDLAKKRGPAFYGDESSQKPPSMLFNEPDGIKALKEAERVYSNCKKLIKA
ncbi:MAG: HEPN domain-containing protein [Euryarchaeota archaeon]|nr:HEPN domain-containing protein [Euryarchaeota archaeon]